MDTETDSKYWIKPGKHVTLGDNEVPVMVVDRVLTSQNKEGRKFTSGVLCHWLNEHGGYEKGTFHTTELKEYINS